MIKFLKFIFCVSVLLLIILSLYPGSLIGYFLYGDLGKQPHIIHNPIGTSINHLFCFMYLTALAVICNLKQTIIFTNLYFIIFISVFLEASHYIIPNRAFEFYDLLANVAGVLIIFLFKRIIK